MNTKTNEGFEFRWLNMFEMKNKIAVLGVLLFLSVGLVGASTVASSNANCVAGQEEFTMTEAMWAKIIMDDYVSTDNGSIWVCPCSWNAENMDTYPNCVEKVMGISIPLGSAETVCANVGLGSKMPDAEICKCYDMIFDAYGDGKFSVAGRDSYDDVGVVNCTAENNCLPTEGHAGFHIYPEAATIVLALSGLVLLFGYTRVRKRK